LTFQAALKTISLFTAPLIHVYYPRELWDTFQNGYCEQRHRAANDAKHLRAWRMAFEMNRNHAEQEYAPWRKD
jgi:hypothetical protein